MFLLCVGLSLVLVTTADVPVEQCLSACNTGYDNCEDRIGKSNDPRLFDCVIERQNCKKECRSKYIASVLKNI